MPTRCCLNQVPCQHLSDAEMAVVFAMFRDVRAGLAGTFIDVLPGLIPSGLFVVSIGSPCGRTSLADSCASGIRSGASRDAAPGVRRMQR